MDMLDIKEKILHFMQPAGTSRGIYTTRRSWYVTITDPADPRHIGIGECAPLPDLSCDAIPDYADVLRGFCAEVERTGLLPYDRLADYPSMLFGLETATLHYIRRSYSLFDTPFSRGEQSIPINGLVWMGRYDEMLHRMEEKLQKGFRCIKIKIGAIDFDRELDLIRTLRSHFGKDRIELRVDANGAFSPDDVFRKLDVLARCDIHSIEQPIRAGQWKEMAEVCAQSPIPVALDEELIGINSPDGKEALLDVIKPSYVVLKPSLHGGMCGTRQWVDLARERGTRSWITSALESNIGLNAIAQLTADIYGPDIILPQGLGTGALFTDNITLPYNLCIEGGRMIISEVL
ncbi:MAG: o-succinylbenzoate synthase [Muribaculaceae bacterium]|nr:o-succinylbenzoate synthase [Muribaculaceae bacterium]